MKKRCKLVLGKPLKQYTPWYSHILAITSVDKGFEGWLYCNNIKLLLEHSCVYDTSDKYALCFEDIPECIETKSVPYEIVLECWSDITLFFKESIELGYYVLVDADPYYLQCFNGRYRKKHSHDTILIYGYSESKFNIAVFCEYPNYKYKKCVCKVEDMQKSLEFKDFQKKEIFWMKNINLIKYKKGMIDFSLKILKHNLSCVGERPDNPNDTRIIAWGNNVFDELQKAVCCGQEISRWVADSLAEYHRIILQRYRYLRQKGYVAKNKILEDRIKENIYLSSKGLIMAKSMENRRLQIQQIKENLIFINDLLLGMLA